MVTQFSVISQTPNVPAKLSRRTFLKRASLVAGTAGLGIAGYAWGIEPNEIELTRVSLKIERLAPALDGFKIALLSDLHFGPFTGEREIGAAVEAANRLHPDLVALIGGFVSTPNIGNKKAAARKAEPCGQVLARLQSRHGSFAVLGNHDAATDPDFVAVALESHGISLLRHSNRAIEQDGGRLWLLGIEDAIESNSDLDTATRGIPKQETKILFREFIFSS